LDGLFPRLLAARPSDEGGVGVRDQHAARVKITHFDAVSSA
jgi:hypothetical protein